MTTMIWTVGAIGAAIVALLYSSFTFSLRKFHLGTTGAEVYLPGSEGFTEANARWSAVDAPTYDMIVKVKSEEDVQKTIAYANKKQKPFLAIAGGHGQNSALGKMRNGIGISMRGIDHIALTDNGTAALVGGGVLAGDLIGTLWKLGKQTATTGCDCVGFIPPLLGGGHGWLQGRYGLAADQLLSARMVLANGSAITVSADVNEELFWAIRGAGHNFGVVTEIKMRVFDREEEQDKWAASGFVFSQDKLEDVYTIVNVWLEETERPVAMVHYGIFAFNPEIDTENPLVILWIYYQGLSIPAKYTDPLYALSPIAVPSNVTGLAEVNGYLMARKDGASCAKGYSRLMYPVNLFKYSVANLRTAFSIFASMPAAYRQSVVMLEGFPVKRVDEIPSESTAFPDRQGRLLIAPLLTYPVNASLDAKAFEIGESMRSAMLEGEAGLKLNAYVNYARGGEAVEAVYGYDAWRLEKLRRLKREYDPEGKFSFYAPIV